MTSQLRMLHSAPLEQGPRTGRTRSPPALGMAKPDALFEYTPAPCCHRHDHRRHYRRRHRYRHHRRRHHHRRRCERRLRDYTIITVITVMVVDRRACRSLSPRCGASTPTYRGGQGKIQMNASLRNLSRPLQFCRLRNVPVVSGCVYVRARARARVRQRPLRVSGSCELWVCWSAGWDVHARIRIRIRIRPCGPPHPCAPPPRRPRRAPASRQLRVSRRAPPLPTAGASLRRPFQSPSQFEVRQWSKSWGGGSGWQRLPPRLSRQEQARDLRKRLAC
eukprot:gene7210-biopygen16526